MKAIVLKEQEIEHIIDHLIAYGYKDIIVYGKVNQDYYLLNDISVIQLNWIENESTRDRLSKIKGSLENRFFVVYSESITQCDMEEIEAFHNKHQCLATLVEIDKCLAGAIFEPEIFDYLCIDTSLERGILQRIGQEGELQIYK